MEPGTANASPRTVQPSSNTNNTLAMGEEDIGFANLPNCIEPNNLEFNLMVAGSSGLGKSTFINSLFECDIYGNTEDNNSSPQGKDTPIVPKSKSVTVTESGVDLKLNIVEVPRLTDRLNRTECWKPMVDYVDKAFEDYMDDESRVHRSTINDKRIHCCIYFIAPTVKRLGSLDIEIMKQLHEKVNLIPVIAKCDLLTQEEREHLKSAIINSLKDNGIKTFNLENPDSDSISTQVTIDSEGKSFSINFPFAVCASTSIKDGKRVREYPWGTLEVENPEHSDFIPFRKLLIGTHLYALVEKTNTFHYEKFRSAKLANMELKNTTKRDDSDGQSNSSPTATTPLAKFEAQKEHYDEMISKKELEMEDVFRGKLAEKQRELADMETKMLEEHEKMDAKLRRQREELEDKRREFEVERAQFFADTPSKKTKRLFK